MNSAAQQLPNLTGTTRSEASVILANQGFQFKTKTQGGYETFQHLDGSQIHIRPNGEIVRTGPKIRAANGKSYRRRYNQYGNQIEFVPGANTHNTGEIVNL
jgi:beta-lactam-binding protein with PASTA domain